MRYRNAKTGAIVNVDSKLGGLWIPVETKKPAKAEVVSVEPVEPVEEVKKAPVRKRTTKKTKK